MGRFSGNVMVPVLVVGAAMGIGPVIYDAASNGPTTYCTDANRTIVDDDRCDNTNPHYGYGHGYYLHSGYYPVGYHSGQMLPASRSWYGSTSSTSIEASDTDGRTRAGYTSSGKVTSGKSGGFGSKSGSGSGGSKGGSGSGGKGGSGGSGGHGGSGGS